MASPSLNISQRRRWGAPRDPLYPIRIPRPNADSTVVMETETRKDATGMVFSSTRYVASPQSEASQLMDTTFRPLASSSMIEPQTLGAQREVLLDARKATYEAVERAYNAKVQFHNQRKTSTDEFSGEGSITNYVMYFVNIAKLSDRNGLITFLIKRICSLKDLLRYYLKCQVKISKF